jgi:hypothetical protein
VSLEEADKSVVSPLFQDIIQCMQIQVLEIKKSEPVCRMLRI